MSKDNAMAAMVAQHQHEAKLAQEQEEKWLEEGTQDAEGLNGERARGQSEAKLAAAAESKAVLESVMGAITNAEQLGASSEDAIKAMKANANGDEDSVKEAM